MIKLNKNGYSLEVDRILIDEDNPIEPYVKEAQLIRLSDNKVIIRARDPEVVEALVDCFTEELTELA